MAGMFYRMGRWVGPRVRKSKWVWTSLTGDEDDLLAAEREVGRDLAEAVLDALGRDEAEQPRRLVRQTGERLAACVANKKRAFVFHAVGGDEPSAFALPGGYVMVSRPLLELMRFDADETAFVLGHEMGHVIKQHPMQRIMTDTTLSAAMKATPLRGVLGGWIKSTGLSLLRSAYSQDNELLADKLGARLAMAAGYDGRAGIAMLSRLKGATGGPDGQPLGSYFATHPTFDVRTDSLQAYLDSKTGSRHADGTQSQG